ncbi:hypothetical protein HY933_01170 [Candidatus Falkowbacteria bacterium]|nr:hypothetical protein [Candidatus Falkowbacteria bacterium]
MLPAIKILSPSRVIVALFVLLTLLIFGVVGALYWHWNLTRRDTLTMLVPADAELYLHLDYMPSRLQGTAVEPLLTQILTAADQYFFTDSALSLPELLTTYSDREIGLLQDSGSRWLMIMKVKRAKELLPLLNGQKNFSLLSGQYLLVSPEPTAAALITAGREQSITTLGDTVPWAHRADQTPIKLYLRADRLTRLTDDTRSQQLIQAYVDQHNLRQLSLSLTPELYFSLSADQPLDRLTALLMTRLPRDTILSVALPDLQDSASRLITDWLQSDPATTEQSPTLWQNYEDSYRFSWTEIAPLLRRPAQLFIGRADARTVYALALRLEPQDDTKQLDTILTNIIARHFPTRVTATLPDGTPVTELLSQPENFRLDSRSINGRTLNIVANDTPVWELGYALDDQWLIIGNSINFLTELLKPENNLNLPSLCPAVGQPSLWLVPGQFLPATQLAPITGSNTAAILNTDNQTITGCWLP